MTPTDLLTAVERELRGAIERALDEGFRLTTADWGIAYAPSRGFFVEDGGLVNGCGCALAAWAIIRQPLVETPQWPGDERLDRDWVNLRLGAAVSNEFGWSSSAFKAFTHAWDGDLEPELAEAHPEIVELAQRLAGDYLQPELRGAA